MPSQPEGIFVDSKRKDIIVFVNCFATHGKVFPSELICINLAI